MLWNFEKSTKIETEKMEKLTCFCVPSHFCVRFSSQNRNRLTIPSLLISQSSFSRFLSLIFKYIGRSIKIFLFEKNVGFRLYEGNLTVRLPFVALFSDFSSLCRQSSRVLLLKRFASQLFRPLGKSPLWDYKSF